MIDFTLFATDKKSGKEKLIVDGANKEKYFEAMIWAHKNGFCGFRTLIFDTAEVPDVKGDFAKTVKV